jgi:hypothetical protein
MAVERSGVPRGTYEIGDETRITTGWVGARFHVDHGAATLDQKRGRLVGTPTRRGNLSGVGPVLTNT